jgi:nucleoside-diphosphate-sugar epimerase
MANDPVRTIVVVGATGNQGRGVVRAILEDPLLSSYYVRALTRDVHSHAAMNLLNSLQTPSTRLSLATADVFNVKSLELAFEGAYGVFAVTTMWKAGTRCETEDDLKGELESGENIVAAAKHAGVKHFVFSSLPNINKASNGRFRKLFHFDHKAAIQELAMQELPATTALHAGERNPQGTKMLMTCTDVRSEQGYFYSNLNWEWVCKRKGNLYSLTSNFLRTCHHFEVNTNVKLS